MHFAAAVRLKFIVRQKVNQMGGAQTGIHLNARLFGDTQVNKFEKSKPRAYSFCVILKKRRLPLPPQPWLPCAKGADSLLTEGLVTHSQSFYANNQVLPSNLRPHQQAQALLPRARQ